MNRNNVKKEKSSSLELKNENGINISRMVKIIRMGKEIRKIDGPKFYGNTAYKCQ